jgi:hypothetical protein
VRVEISLSRRHAESTAEGTMRYALAVFLGVISFVLVFALGESNGDANIGFAAELAHLQPMFQVIGAYSLAVSFPFCRGPRKRGVRMQLILALNAPLLLITLLALFVESNKGGVLLTRGIAGLALVLSGAGAALAASSPGAK